VDVALSRTPVWSWGPPLAGRLRPSTVWRTPAAFRAIASLACAGSRSRPWAALPAWHPRLDDFQWSVAPRPAYGAQALAGAGLWSGGVRLWSSQSRQEIDPGSSASEATVYATSLELVGRARLASRWGTSLSADVTGGLLRLSYAPDHAQVVTGSGTVDVESIRSIPDSRGLVRAPDAAVVRHARRTSGSELEAVMHGTATKSGASDSRGSAPRGRNTGGWRCTNAMKSIVAI
jgi:hypothetical protein